MRRAAANATLRKRHAAQTPRANAASVNPAVRVEQPSPQRERERLGGCVQGRLPSAEHVRSTTSKCHGRQ
ncbi:hypothetical protein ABWU93_16125 [Xanthomonas translucens pv. translucens]|uniref:hypothetical protein n=1 Tax=Xanthomonas campestris pv. translucens TaxID=343 RepID=UPI003F6F774B